MARPNAKMKITKKDGITFQSNIDYVLFTIEELINAANRDVGKLIAKETANAIFKSYKPNFVKGRKLAPRKNKFKKTYANKTIQYWARKNEHDLQVGYKNPNWMMQQELGEFKYPRLGLLRETTFRNIPNIKKVQSKYLTALNEKKPRIPSGSDKGDGE